ncbi:MAG: thiamine-phosphate kinase [Deltaproteobacteria bacterium]|nr:thiamine-phosphate kinase [Deltaproteobacteria bacterium]MBW2359818.1 thiamine-phosphate kinase [Deltaproteobacteria bacterium]
MIERIRRAAGRRPAGAVALGIGDDAAVLRPRTGEDIVASTDAMVEGVHFRFGNESARSVGRRALVANLSDLAAMGARPLGFLWALAAPPRLDVRVVDGLLRGLLDEAELHGCPLVGGNCSAAREVSLTLTVLGAVKRGCALTRRGARAGDGIYVTGVLGAAALDRSRAERGGRVRFVAEPRLAAGRALARMRGVGACIDVSDGLDADLAQLFGGRPLRPHLDVERLPVVRGFRAACARLGLDPEALARGGGEDYELLFTLRPGALSEAALSRRLAVSVTCIGHVAAGRAPRRKAAGWSHFRA